MFNKQFEIIQNYGDYLYFSDKKSNDFNKKYYALDKERIFYVFSKDEKKWADQLSRLKICEISTNQLTLYYAKNHFLQHRIDLQDLEFYIVNERASLEDFNHHSKIKDGESETKL